MSFARRWIVSHQRVVAGTPSAFSTTWFGNTKPPGRRCKSPSAKEPSTRSNRTFHNLPAGVVIGRSGRAFDRRQSIPTQPRRSFERSEEHTSELQSHSDLVCRLLLE